MSDPVFATHFPRLAVVPGVCLMQSVIHLARMVLAANQPADKIWNLKMVRSARFQKYVRPGDQLHLNVRLQEISENTARFSAAGEIDEDEAVILRRLEFAAEETKVAE